MSSQHTGGSRDSRINTISEAHTQ